MQISAGARVPPGFTRLSCKKLLFAPLASGSGYQKRRCTGQTAYRARPACPGGPCGAARPAQRPGGRCSRRPSAAAAPPGRACLRAAGLLSRHGTHHEMAFCALTHLRQRTALGCCMRLHARDPVAAQQPSKVRCNSTALACLHFCTGRKKSQVLQTHAGSACRSARPRRGARRTHGQACGHDLLRLLRCDGRAHDLPQGSA